MQMLLDDFQRGEKIFANFSSGPPQPRAKQCDDEGPEKERTANDINAAQNAIILFMHLLITSRLGPEIAAKYSVSEVMNLAPSVAQPQPLHPAPQTFIMVTNLNLNLQGNILWSEPGLDTDQSLHHDAAGTVNRTFFLPSMRFSFIFPSFFLPASKGYLAQMMHDLRP
jgi:hypothetical protein